MSSGKKSLFLVFEVKSMFHIVCRRQWKACSWALRRPTCTIQQRCQQHSLLQQRRDGRFWQPTIPRQGKQSGLAHKLASMSDLRLSILFPDVSAAHGANCWLAWNLTVFVHQVCGCMHGHQWICQRFLSCTPAYPEIFWAAEEGGSEPAGIAICMSDFRVFSFTRRGEAGNNASKYPVGNEMCISCLPLTISTCMLRALCMVSHPCMG